MNTILELELYSKTTRAYKYDLGPWQALAAVGMSGKRPMPRMFGVGEGAGRCGYLGLPASF